MINYVYDEEFLDTVEGMKPSDIVGALVDMDKFNKLVDETGLTTKQVAENLIDFKKDPEGLAQAFYDLGGYEQEFADVCNEMIEVDNTYGNTYEYSNELYMYERYDGYCNDEHTFLECFEQVLVENPIYLWDLMSDKYFVGTEQWENVNEVIEEILYPANLEYAIEGMELSEFDRDNIEGMEWYDVEEYIRENYGEDLADQFEDQVRYVDQLDFNRAIDEIVEDLNVYELKFVLYETNVGDEIRENIEWKMAYEKGYLKDFLEDYCANIEPLIEIKNEYYKEDTER